MNSCPQTRHKSSKVDTLVIAIEFLLFSYFIIHIYTVLVVRKELPEEAVQDLGLNANGTYDDPTIVRIGNFAVDEYNKVTGGRLKFEKVVKAMQAQSSYMTVIEVMDGSILRRYGAVVVVQKGDADAMSLVAFDEYPQYDL